MTLSSETRSILLMLFFLLDFSHQAIILVFNLTPGFFFPADMINIEFKSVSDTDKPIIMVIKAINQV